MNIMKANLGISTPVALIMVIALVISAWLLFSGKASKDNSAVHATAVNTQGKNVQVQARGNHATGWVTTNADGLVIVHDRGARFNFIPAKAGMNNDGVTSGPTTK